VIGLSSIHREEQLCCAQRKNEQQQECRNEIFHGDVFLRIKKVGKRQMYSNRNTQQILVSGTRICSGFTTLVLLN